MIYISTSKYVFNISYSAYTTASVLPVNVDQQKQAKLTELRFHSKNDVNKMQVDYFFPMIIWNACIHIIYAIHASVTVSYIRL